MNTTPDNPDAGQPQQPEPPPPWPGVPASPPPPQVPRASIPVKRKPHEMVPMEQGIGVGPAISSLLKSPGSILYELTSGRRAGRVAISLWVITVLGLLVFGAVTGSISGGTQWWAAPAKVTGGVLFASLICLPSLYIFAALSGMALRLNAITGILLSTTGLTALLLAGFTPLVWVFGQSTGSIRFMGGLLLVIWLFSILFGMNLLIKCARALGMTDGFHLWIWCFMFLLVTLQVSCALRPIIGTANTLLPKEKKFFLQHWADNLNAEAGNNRPATAAASGAR
jgi:hypothetical protein